MNIFMRIKTTQIFLSADGLWGCQHLNEDVTFPKRKDGKKVKNSGDLAISV